MMQRSIGQRMAWVLRIACAMCFIGHGAFGIITKPIWCNYFAVFGIGEKTAYQLMPVVGALDIAMGLIVLFYPVRAVFIWLAGWGVITALLRPLSGEPVAEFVERAGNYGAPFLLLLLTAAQSKQGIFSRLSVNVNPDERTLKRVRMGLRVAGFLLLAGHAWLNLLGKKALLAQYASLGFSDTHAVSMAIGVAELSGAVILLLRPSPQLVLLLFFWKMASELFYPHYELLEWVERGGSYGVLLALWLSVRIAYKMDERVGAGGNVSAFAS